jgi:hypothetical protein
MMSTRATSILLYGLGIGCILAMLSGCATYYQAKNLSPDEQAEFRIYRKLMNAPQRRTYLAKASAAERTAYLEEIGLAQRFDALDPEDRDSVQAGFIRKGMSAQALRFLWGPPTHSKGDPDHYAYWYYYGPVPDLVRRGSRPQDAGTRVEVYLVDNQVEWWIETVVPDEEPDASDPPIRS